MAHIALRFGLHFIASYVLVLVFYFALSYWVRTNTKVNRFISSDPNHLLVFSALLVFALLPLREPYDVAFGTQVWYKAIFDQISWFSGGASSAWVYYRLRKGA